VEITSFKLRTCEKIGCHAQVVATASVDDISAVDAFDGIFSHVLTIKWSIVLGGYMRYIVLCGLVGLLLHCAAPVHKSAPSLASVPKTDENQVAQDTQENQDNGEDQDTLEGQEAIPDLPEEPPAVKGKQLTFCYYPDIEVYWNVKAKRYIMQQNKKWVEVAGMPDVVTPAQYYVVIETGSPTPWNYHAKYKRRYPPYKPPKRKKK
jgi:hypothetical protein